MDALGLDCMHEEYQECRRNVENELSSSTNELHDSKYETEIGSGSTVQVQEDEVIVHAESDSANRVSNQGSRGSKNSNNSTSSTQEDSSGGSATLYHPSCISPTINYGKDFPSQKLIAVFGRQFDQPDEIANSFQRLISKQNNTSSVKFVPFTLKRKNLKQGTYSSNEVMKHDLICMCYNASEARILLTGDDGFYTSLLRHTEAILGED